MPEISICIPTFNQPIAIEQLLERLVNQYNYEFLKNKMNLPLFTRKKTEENSRYRCKKIDRITFFIIPHNHHDSLSRT